MGFIKYDINNKINYIYNSTLNLIFLKQNILINNYFLLNKLIINLNFIFIKINDLNKLKIFNNIIFIWLFINKLLKIRKLNVKLDKGIKYYKFFLNINILKKKISFEFLNFLINNNNFEKFENKKQNKIIFRIKNFSNFEDIKLLKFFYIPKVDNQLNICIYFKFKKYMNINYFLKQFKL